VANDKVEFTGTGQPGGEIKVSGTDGAVIGTTTVGSDGKWKLTPDKPLPVGQQKVTVQQTADGKTSTATTTFIATGTQKTTITLMQDPKTPLRVKRGEQGFVNVLVTATAKVAGDRVQHTMTVPTGFTLTGKVAFIYGTEGRSTPLDGPDVKRVEVSNATLSNNNRTIAFERPLNLMDGDGTGDTNPHPDGFYALDIKAQDDATPGKTNDGSAAIEGYAPATLSGEILP
jgi:hypothetical protein